MPGYKMPEQPKIPEYKFTIRDFCKVNNLVQTPAMYEVTRKWLDANG